MLQPELVIGVSLLYILALFLVASWADHRQSLQRSIVANPHIYSLSIAVYATTWTFYGSVGKAATTGLDFLLIYLGPSLTAFSWWFILRKTVRICKENNITSIADFISSRYGKSQRLGALVTLIAILGIMPYIALQLKAVSTSFEILCGQPHVAIPVPGRADIPVDTSALAAGGPGPVRRPLRRPAALLHRAARGARCRQSPWNPSSRSAPSWPSVSLSPSSSSTALTTSSAGWPLPGRNCSTT